MLQHKNIADPVALSHDMGFQKAGERGREKKNSHWTQRIHAEDSSGIRWFPIDVETDVTDNQENGLKDRDLNVGGEERNVGGEESRGAWESSRSL